jgi:hypothetical protein
LSSLIIRDLGVQGLGPPDPIDDGTSPGPSGAVMAP